MKVKRILIPTFLMLVLLVNLNAQEKAEDCIEKEPHGKCMNIPDLTDDQKNKIEEIHIMNAKETLQLKNQLKEKKAHHKTLMTQDKPDMNAINTNIDEMGALQTEIMKKKAKARLETRELLNDKQKVYFDTHWHEKGGHKGMHHRKDMKHKHMGCEHK